MHTAVFQPSTALPTARSIARADTLYYAGDHSDSLYRLESGLLRAVYLTAQGRHLTVRHYLPGDLFGEEVLQDVPRRYQVSALTEATVAAVHPSALSGEGWQQLGQSMATQLARIMGEVVHLQDGELRQRIARYLLTLSRTELGERGASSGLPSVRVTHELIAEGTGATRESVSKLIGEMRDDGLLQPAYRCLTLLDVAALEDLAHAEM